MKPKMTKRDESPRDELSPQQEQAADLLAVGTNITDTAEAVGVARQTVSEWVNAHAGFQTALNRRRAELWDSTADRLRNLATKAVARLERELEADGPGGLKAAEMILKALGVLDAGRPTGKTDAGEIEDDRREADGWKAITRGLLNG